MRTNKSIAMPPVVTHEGGRAAPHVSPEQMLRRSVLSCMLFENEFYEDGVSISERIKALVGQVPAGTVAALAVEARSQFNLRHVPLMLMAALAGAHQGTSLVSDTLPRVIQRADEMAEFLAIYAKINGVSPKALKPKLSNQVRKGLATAFVNFNEYALGKYNRDGAVKLRDVMFLCHPKPRDPEQKAMWERLIAGTLATPDTWEVELSAGKDKRETFTRLIEQGKLGYLALLRNLRNMNQAGVDHALVKDAILARKGGAERVLPFRYVAAARACPAFEPELDTSLVQALRDLPALPGRTVVLVDVSGSMNDKLSAKSDLTRVDAAATLASMIVADHLRVFSFSDRTVEVPPRRGMAGVDAITHSQAHSGTRLFDAVDWVNRQVPYDRLIVITDEQASGSIGSRYLQGTIGQMPAPIGGKGYMINVASAQNGVGYGKWVHLDGFSERVLLWIAEHEKVEAANL